MLSNQFHLLTIISFLPQNSKKKKRLKEAVGPKPPVKQKRSNKTNKSGRCPTPPIEQIVLRGDNTSHRRQPRRTKQTSDPATEEETCEERVGTLEPVAAQNGSSGEAVLELVSKEGADSAGSAEVSESEGPLAVSLLARDNSLDKQLGDPMKSLEEGLIRFVNKKYMVILYSSFLFQPFSSLSVTILITLSKPKTQDLKRENELLNVRISELKADILVINSQLNNKFIDVSSEVPAWIRPHPDSKILVSRKRLIDAERSSTFTEYTLRTFTAFVSVEDAYRTNLEGRASTINKDAQRKKAIDKEILKEIHDTVYYQFKAAIDAQTEAAEKNKVRFNWKSKVNLMVGKKLQSIARHFEAIKACKEKDNNLTEEDKEDFRDYERYIKDLSLFRDLDAKIDQQLARSSAIEPSIQTSSASKTTTSISSSHENLASTSGSVVLKEKSKAEKKRKYPASSSSSSSSSSSDDELASSSEDDSQTDSIVSKSEREKRRLAKTEAIFRKLMKFNKSSRK